MSKAFDKIAAGLNEVLAIARGEAEPAKIHPPEEIDVRTIRTRLGLSQEGFAAAYGFTINQIRDWEQGRSKPLGGVRTYLLVIEREPKRIASVIRRAAASRTFLRTPAAKVSRAGRQGKSRATAVVRSS
jgi:putative transcriptional regulator